MNVPGIADAQRIVEEQTGRALRRIERLGTGLENVAFLADDHLVVRFAVDDEGDPGREAELLALVAEVASLPVPRPAFVVAHERCLAYELLPGVPLLQLAAAERAAAADPIARELGGLLAALHAIDTERVAHLVGVDDDGFDVWLADARGHYETAADAIPAGQRGVIERFLATPPPPRGDGRVFSHNDLGIEHVLVDPGTLQLTGVIDWSDAALTDPAYDFGLLLRDLGEPALDTALAAYGSDEPATRAPFYAWCALLEDIAYGIESARGEYVVNGLDALTRLSVP